jgi:predicted GIY-YIG superfamily endonuclease
MASPYRVYVLQNSAGKYYIGLSEDVARRVEQHNFDQSKYTKGKGPWTLRWMSEEFSLGDARRLENRLKRQKGGIGFHSITGLSRS